MTSTTMVSTKGLRTLCLVLIALGLLAAGAALYRRAHAEAANRAVELVADYNEVVALSGQEGVLPNKVMKSLQGVGVTAVALQEETLNNMEREGRITFVARPNFADGHHQASWQPNDAIFEVDTTDMATNMFIQDGLSRVYPKENLVAEAPFRVVVRGNRDFVADLGLGLDGSKVGLIQAMGLRVIPRLRGGAGVTARSLSLSLAQVGDVLGNPLTTPSSTMFVDKNTGKPAPSAPRADSVVVFDGDTIPGYRDLIDPDLVNALNQNHLIYGAVEFGKQKGDEELGKALKGHLVRVHSITLAELGTLTPNQVVQRFCLAVKDRNIRVLFMHLPPVASADPLQHATDFAGAIAKELHKEGYVTSDKKPARPFAEISVPKPLLALIFAGAGAALLLWVLVILPAALPVWWVRVGYLLVGILLAKSVALPFLVKFTWLGVAGFGLAAAIGFPLLGLTYAYRAVDRLAKQRPAHALWDGIVTLLVTTGITLLGGLSIAGMMSDTRYLVKVSQFVGVKATLAVPLVLFAVLIMADAVALVGESWPDYVRRTREKMRAFLAQPLYVWGVIVALVALVAVGLALARSGNDSGVGVSTSELHFRAVLERFLIARPRTKEFLFGHPLFLFAMAAASRGKRPLAMALLLGAVIGQADVLNTYCHAHTPIVLSLLRSVNGLWLGILIGAGLLLLFGYRGAKQA